MGSTLVPNNYKTHKEDFGLFHSLLFSTVCNVDSFRFIVEIMFKYFLKCLLNHIWTLFFISVHAYHKAKFLNLVIYKR